MTRFLLYFPPISWSNSSTDTAGWVQKLMPVILAQGHGGLHGRLHPRQVHDDQQVGHAQHGVDGLDLAPLFFDQVRRLLGPLRDLMPLTPSAEYLPNIRNVAI